MMRYFSTAALLALISMFVFPVFAKADLVGNWHGQSARTGQWYSGPWKLTGTGKNRTMYYNGSDSACPGQAIAIKYSQRGKNFTLFSSGCGTTHHAEGKVGSSRINFQKNKYGKPYITNVRGW